MGEEAAENEKKKGTNRIAIIVAGITCAGAALCGGLAYHAEHTYAFTTENGQTVYVNGFGKHAVGWTRINGDNYHFENDGTIDIGAAAIDGAEYGFDEDGKQLTGLVQMPAGRWYAFTGENGKSVTGWVSTDDGKTYYLTPEHTKAEGLTQIEDSTYGFDDSGVRLSGVQTIDGKLYVLADDGKAQTGWVQDETMYCTDDYTAATGFQAIDGQLYDFDEHGVKLTGEQVDSEGNAYDFGNDGAALTGWNADHTKYYGEDHVRVTGLQTIDGSLHDFGDDGVMLTGEQTGADGQVYNFGSDGAGIMEWNEDHTKYYGSDYARVSGLQTIDGRVYQFADDGTLQEDLGTVAEYEAALAEKQKKNALASAAGNQGDQGNLYVPDLGINVALYGIRQYTESNEEFEYYKSICNAANSACYYTDWPEPCIADHNYQGFSALVNATGHHCYVTQGSTVTEYVCTGVYEGVNTGDGIYQGGTHINEGSKIADLLMYTCQPHSTGHDIYLIYWQKV